MEINELRRLGYIVQLNRKDFILYTGLIALAHQRGLLSIETEPIELDFENVRFVFKAVAKGKNGEIFTGYGDATKFNVSKNILPHAIRMAETRAKARALRDFTGLGITAYIELGPE